MILQCLGCEQEPWSPRFYLLNEMNGLSVVVLSENQLSNILRTDSY
jgi:hypothetical protein